MARMRVLQSRHFKWQCLLKIPPGGSMSIQCESAGDYESKATCARSSWKRNRDQYEAVGIKGLKVQKAGECTVLVTTFTEPVEN